MTAHQQHDLVHLARAIRLAERGNYTTAPNPRVGCVIVKHDLRIAEAWHQWAGQGHAEVLALAQAGEAAQGATVYVSLEPCNHQGRTGPCAQALIEAGVRRVVYAAADEGKSSAGGAQRLREAGIAVEQIESMAAEARALNPGFHRRSSGGRPWVRLKLAQSLDGRSALSNGQSQWITGPAARRDGHRWRARSCAIVTGIGTVLADNPRLSARLDEDCAQPLPVIFDRLGRTSLDSALAQRKALVFQGPEGRYPGGETLSLQDGQLDLQEGLQTLSARGLNELLVEAGPQLSGAFLAQGLVDELIIYQAASWLGEGKPSLQLGPWQDLAERIDCEILEHRRFGADSRIIARPLTSD